MKMNTRNTKKINFSQEKKDIRGDYPSSKRLAAKSPNLKSIAGRLWHTTLPTRRRKNWRDSKSWMIVIRSVYDGSCAIMTSRDIKREFFSELPNMTMRYPLQEKCLNLIYFGEPEPEPEPESESGGQVYLSTTQITSLLFEIIHFKNTSIHRLFIHHQHIA